MTLVGLGLFLGFALFFEGAIGLSGERCRTRRGAAVRGDRAGRLMVVLSLVRSRPGQRA